MSLCNKAGLMVYFRLCFITMNEIMHCLSSHESHLYIVCSPGVIVIVNQILGSPQNTVTFIFVILANHKINRLRI